MGALETVGQHDGDVDDEVVDPEGREGHDLFLLCFLAFVLGGAIDALVLRYGSLVGRRLPSRRSGDLRTTATATTTELSRGRRCRFSRRCIHAQRRHGDEDFVIPTGDGEFFIVGFGTSIRVLALLGVTLRRLRRRHRRGQIPLVPAHGRAGHEGTADPPPPPDHGGDGGDQRILRGVGSVVVVERQRVGRVLDPAPPFARRNVDRGGGRCLCLDAILLVAVHLAQLLFVAAAVVVIGRQIALGYSDQRNGLCCSTCTVVAVTTTATTSTPILGHKRGRRSRAAARGPRTLSGLVWRVDRRKR